MDYSLGMVLVFIGMLYLIWKDLGRMDDKQKEEMDRDMILWSIWSHHHDDD